jgi:mannose-6-phosphate isomerase-like protein (cupin superfamily)
VTLSISTVVLASKRSAPAGLAGDPGLKASRHSTGGALSVIESSIGAGPPLHVHDREDECFYVMDGELSIRCGGEAFDAAAGSFVFLPRGLEQQLRAEQDTAQTRWSALAAR